MYNTAFDHESLLARKYLEAKKQESTVKGSVGRKARRGIDRLKGWARKKTGDFSKTRIGKELGVSAKMLILGTKAFYDLQDPNADIMTWALSYEDDVNQLMRDVEEIERMDQPSITGKNTFLEGLLDEAYRKSFERDD